MVPSAALRLASFVAAAFSAAALLFSASSMVSRGASYTSTMVLGHALISVSSTLVVFALHSTMGRRSSPGFTEPSRRILRSFV